MARYKITTPELVDFSYQPAGLVTRSLACLIDQLLLILLMMGAGFVVGSAAGIIGENVANAILYLLIFLIQFGYFVFFELRSNGQSPGKQVFKLRVVSASGGRLTPDDILIRNVLRAVDFLPFGYFLGLVAAFMDPYHRRFGDLAAGTLVIQDSLQRSITFQDPQRKRANSFETDPAIRSRILQRINREERDLVWDLMLRRDELDPAIREELFQQTALYLRERFSLPSDLDYLSDEQTVLNIALVVQSAGSKFAPIRNLEPIASLSL